MIKRSLKLLFYSLVLAFGLLSSMVVTAQDFEFFSLDVDSRWFDFSPGDYGDGIETKMFIKRDTRTCLTINAQSTDRPLTQEEFQELCKKIFKEHFHIYGYTVISSHFDGFEAVFKVHQRGIPEEIRMRHQNSVIVWITSTSNNEEEGWALAEKIRIK